MNAVQQQVKPQSKPKPAVAAVAFAPPSVVPFTMLDMPKWGEWLLMRLQRHWPHMVAMNYQGMIGQWMADRGCTMQRTERAVIMATVSRDAFEPQQTVKIIFCFRHHPNDVREDADVKLLIERVETWARAHNAADIRVDHPERIDLPGAHLSEVIGTSQQVVKRLEAK